MPTPHVLKIKAATFVVDTAIYASGDLIGPKLTFDLSAFKDDGGAMLEAVTLADESKNSANIDLILFDSDPSGTTFSDNGALDIADADLLKVIAIVPITTHHTFNDNGVSRAAGLGIPIPIERSQASSTLYGALVSRATPTFTATTDAQVALLMRKAQS